MGADLPTDPTELARLLVASPAWGWRAGMLADLYGTGRHLGFITAAEPDYATDPPGPSVPVAWEDDGRLRGPQSGNQWDEEEWDFPDALPDLTHAGTRAEVLEALRERRGRLTCVEAECACGGDALTMACCKRGRRWYVVDAHGNQGPEAPTEPAALVAAWLHCDAYGPLDALRAALEVSRG